MHNKQTIDGKRRAADRVGKARARWYGAYRTYRFTRRFGVVVDYNRFLAIYEVTK